MILCLRLVRNAICSVLSCTALLGPAVLACLWISVATRGNFSTLAAILAVLDEMALLWLHDALMATLLTPLVAVVLLELLVIKKVHLGHLVVSPFYAVIEGVRDVGHVMRTGTLIHFVLFLVTCVHDVKAMRVSHAGHVREEERVSHAGTRLILTMWGRAMNGWEKKVGR